MNSLNHHATLFDHFYFSNFGYGGDPNEASRKVRDSLTLAPLKDQREVPERRFAKI